MQLQVIDDCVSVLVVDCRWAASILRMDLLLLASQHLFVLPRAVWRPAVALHIYTSRIAPLLVHFVELEDVGGSLVHSHAAGKEALEKLRVQKQVGDLVVQS